MPGAARRWAGGDHSPGLALWRKLAGAGVTALAVPPGSGGLGASWLDVVIACEELGHHAVPGPVAESVAAVPELIAALADERLSARWLPGLAAGDLIATLALPPWLPYAADADAAGLVLLAEPGAVRLATAGTRHRSVDPARSLSQARGHEVLAQGPRGGRGGGAGARGGHAGLRGAAARRGPRPAGGRRQPCQAAEPVRPADRIVPGGQAPARRRGDRARVRPAAARRGGRRRCRGERTAARDVSAAKVACTAAAQRAARAALQVHGAIGYTQEHDLHLWLTKVRALAGAWGSQAEHRARVMAAIADGSLAWS